MVFDPLFQQPVVFRFLQCVLAENSTDGHQGNELRVEERVIDDGMMEVVQPLELFVFRLDGLWVSFLLFHPAAEDGQQG